MQTFLPYPSFVDSLRCLDDRRLGKQRVEARQILDVLGGKTNGWRNHPAVLMWEGFENWLIFYFNCALCVWSERGYNNIKLQQYSGVSLDYSAMPDWLGDEKYHASHRSNLLRKNDDHYSKFGWTEPDNLPYVWPVKMEA